MRPLIIAFVLGASLFAGISLSQVFRNESALERYLRTRPEPVLIGGEATTDYPEAVYIRVGSSRCTATIVGPHAVLTAAHCIGNGSKATFDVAGRTYTGIGRRAPLYPRPDQDVAMIHVEEEITGVTPASISGTIADGDIVKLSGYGCTRAGGSGGNDGTFRHGDSRVTSLPSENGYDFVTTAENGAPAALCYGDSGGPVWKYVGDTRTIVGVNSKGNIRSVSYLSYLQKPKTQEFFVSWAQNVEGGICGVTRNCAAPIPPRPECRHEQDVVSFIKGELTKAENRLALCQR